MRIRDAQVDWQGGLISDPQLQVFVDEIPDRSELRYDHDDSIWCAISDGYVDYFHWSGEGNDGGMSGRCYEITTVDGEQVTLRGPWSSRAGCVNQRRFGPVVDVRLTTDPGVLDRGYTFRVGTLTLEAAKQAIDLVDDASHLERRMAFSSDEPVWVPIRKDGGDA